MQFSKDNQPPNRGRKKTTGSKPTLRVSVKQETKEFYNKRRGLAGKVLEEYHDNNK